MSAISRRRVIALFAALPGLAMAGETTLPSSLYRWSGAALGADATITLAAASPKAAQTIIDDALGELRHLEAMFSLFDSNSDISRLNRNGRLMAAPGPFIDLLNISRSVHQTTGGQFDPAIHKAWLAYAEDRAVPSGGTPRPRFDQDVDIAGAEIRFKRPGMALTLNGIAQGFITDRIAERFRAHGLTDILVNLGEYRALGEHPDGRPWRIAIDRQKAASANGIDLSSSAIATSAPFGTRLGANGQYPQMIDPHTGRPTALWSQVSVQGPSAAIADGLSTAFCMMDAPAIRQSLAQWEGYRALLLDLSGAWTRLGA